MEHGKSEMLNYLMSIAVSSAGGGGGGGAMYLDWYGYTPRKQDVSYWWLCYQVNTNEMDTKIASID